jgi:hypothetical protein
MAGWQLTVDETLPTTRAEVTIITHLRRDANGQLDQNFERWVRLGKDYTQALQILIEHQKQQLEKDAAQKDALAAKQAELKGD